MRRWRPALALVLGGALAGTLARSFAGLVTLRYLGPVTGFRHAAMILGLVIAGATAVLGWLLVRLLLRPIRELERYARAQEAATPPDPPAHFGTRELQGLATRVIAMAEALRDREATIRAYTDHVTHELKTPVSVLRAAIELLEDGGTLSDTDRRLLAQIDGARRQIEDQLAALRRAAQARETRYLGQTTLATVLPDLARDHPGLTLSTGGRDLPLPLSDAGLRIVLGQLLRNATENGAASVALRAEADKIGPQLLVSDDGQGISQGNAGRIFDPFFTTRRAQGGTGMGLAVVRNILQAHRADITLDPSAAGATFRLAFGPEGA